MESWKLLFIWIGALFLGQLVGNSIFLPIEFLLWHYNILNTSGGAIVIITHVITIIIVCSLFLDRCVDISKMAEDRYQRRINAVISEERLRWEEENKKAQAIAGPKEKGLHWEVETIRD